MGKPSEGGLAHESEIESAFGSWLGNGRMARLRRRDGFCTGDLCRSNLVVGPYVVRQTVIAPPASIVRERTVVVTRAPYLPPPVYRSPLPPYWYVAEIDYQALGW